MRVKTVKCPCTRFNYCIYLPIYLCFCQRILMGEKFQWSYYRKRPRTRYRFKKKRFFHFSYDMKVEKNEEEFDCICCGKYTINYLVAITVGKSLFTLLCKCIYQKSLLQCEFPIEWRLILSWYRYHEGLYPTRIFLDDVPLSFGLRLQR